MSRATSRVAGALGLVACVGLCTPTSVAAATGDVEAWLEAGVRGRVPSDLTVGLSAQLKLDARDSQVQSVLPQAEVSYRALSWLRFGGGYRLIYERTKRGDFEYGHRVFGDGQLVLPAAGVRIKYRLRVQDEWEWTRDGELESKPTLRNLLGVSVRVRKWLRPTISAEHFLAVDALDTQPTRKWRMTAGPQLELANVELEPFYRVEMQRDDVATVVTHILGLSVGVEPWAD